MGASLGIWTGMSRSEHILAAQDELRGTWGLAYYGGLAPIIAPLIRQRSRRGSELRKLYSEDAAAAGMGTDGHLSIVGHHYLPDDG